MAVVKKKVPDKKKVELVEKFSSGPTYKGPRVEVVFPWSHVEYTIIIEPWKQKDIDARDTVKTGTPLFVVTRLDGDGYPYRSTGYALLKTTIKEYSIREGRHDWREPDLTSIGNVVAQVWVCATVPDHPLVMRDLARRTKSSQYEKVREALKQRFQIFGGVGEWWRSGRMKELKIFDGEPVKARRRKKWA